MTDDDRRVLICDRVADVPGPAVPASVAGCERCGFAIWISHSSPEHDEAICMRCAAKLALSKADFESPTDEQLAQLREFIGRGQAAQKAVDAVIAKLTNKKAR